jgi:beta-RFAP synthase
MSRHVQVHAPSRLHFGLWALGGDEGRQFGGVGVMIARPATRLSITPADGFSTAGLSSDRVVDFARRWAAFHGQTLPGCRIEVFEQPAEHAGLGTGTQLGLSIAAGLSAFAGLPTPSPSELAQSVGRGLRSAVGTYGFVFGGLIVEQGRLPSETISPLDSRLDLPDSWRLVLLRPRGLVGLAGDEEAKTLKSLPRVEPAVTRELAALVRKRLIPAAASGDFPAFAEGLYRYGNLSGQCFAARQGGAYNGPVLAALVDWARQAGYLGVGQSSWGPTIFVAAESVDAAAEVARRALALRLPTGPLDLAVEISPPCNRGAQIDVLEVNEGSLP